MSVLAFAPRVVPLAPRAALYPRAEVTSILERFDDERPAGLIGVVTEAWLVVLGAAEALPWTAGARYFGRDERAPQLLLSTALAPTLPVDLLERSIARRARAPGPWLLDDQSHEVISVSAARRFSLERLSGWATNAQHSETPSEGATP